MRKVSRGFLAWRYIMFFMMIAMVVTCSFLLFFNSMQVDRSVLVTNALLTFGNVVLLSGVCCLIEWLMRRFTVDKPIREIRDATRRMTEGDMDVRIETDKFQIFSEDFYGIAEDFNQMAEELSMNAAIRTDFISNVSHEMKTPLAIIKNYARLLEQPGVTEEQRQEYTEGIGEAADRMSQLITNILKLNKLEHQQISPVVSEYDLTEQVAECLLSFDEAMERKNLDLECNMDERILVRNDPELLTLIWNNLISNAIKFSEDGQKIIVSVYTQEDQAVVSVQDFGCGMDEKTGRHIFDKFYQGDTSHATEGNGLGLALVKRVVDLTGGTISVESELGRGSLFTVKIQRVHGSDGNR